jgi:alpha-beta hydrolase superfamily lysophospholipase
MVYARCELLAIRLAALVVALHLVACVKSAQTGSDPHANREESVHVLNGDVNLAGTLVLPNRSNRHPAVVLFHGSGPQARDLFTARWFANQGFAALAYDKRGVGESTGDFRAVPFMDLCGDGLAAIAYLKSRHDIDPAQIGVWGLSQGGWLGPLAASRSSDVAFVIAVSGPAVSPGEQMIFYYANELRAEGVPERDVQDASILRRNVWNYLSTGNGYDDVKEQMNRSRTKSWYTKVKAQQDDLFAPLQSPDEIRSPDYRYKRWFKEEMIYDPLPALKALHVPTLFLFGDEDRLVNVNETVAVLRRVLTESRNRDYTIRVFPHVEHDMHLMSGPDAYTMDPEYLQTMQQWLAAHIRQ